VFFNFLAAFASEDESAAVAAGFLSGVEDFVDAAVSFAILVMVRESSRVIATALELSSRSLSRSWWCRKALISELESSKGRVSSFEKVEISSHFECELVVAGAELFAASVVVLALDATSSRIERDLVSAILPVARKLLAGNVD